MPRHFIFALFFGSTVAFAAEPFAPLVINGCGIWPHTRCPGVDRRHANLAGKNLAGADFTGAKLARADLRGANLAGAIFDGADLTAARLNNANLQETKFFTVNFRQADLSGTYRRFAVFQEADFEGCTGCPTDW